MGICLKYFEDFPSGKIIKFSRSENLKIKKSILFLYTDVAWAKNPFYKRIFRKVLSAHREKLFLL